MHTRSAIWPLLALWAVVGVVVGSAVFDWWMHGAIRDFQLRVAHFELGRGPEPGLAALLADARASGVRRAATWGGLVAAAGWLTVLCMRNSRT